MGNKKVLQKVENFIWIIAFIFSIFARVLIGVMSFSVLIYFLDKYSIHADVWVLRFYLIAIMFWIIMPFLEGLNKVSSEKGNNTK